jgi:hypothetical protein
MFCSDSIRNFVLDEKLKPTRQIKSDQSEELRDFRPAFSSGPPRFYRGPKYAKQNCSVLDEVLQADICTPGISGRLPCTRTVTCTSMA